MPTCSLVIHWLVSLSVAWTVSDCRQPVSEGGGGGGGGWVSWVLRDLGWTAHSPLNLEVVRAW